jgi:hypothetical protein
MVAPRAQLALMSRREPLLAKNHMAIYLLGAAWATDGLRQANIGRSKWRDAATSVGAPRKEQNRMRTAFR